MGEKPVGIVRGESDPKTKETEEAESALEDNANVPVAKGAHREKPMRLAWEMWWTSQKLVHMKDTITLLEQTLVQIRRQIHSQIKQAYY